MSDDTLINNLNDREYRKFTSDSLGNTAVRTTAECVNTNGVPVDLAIYGGKFVPEEFTEAVITYTGEDMTQVVYKNGLTTIATITLTYEDDKLINIKRT